MTKKADRLRRGKNLREAKFFCETLLATLPFGMDIVDEKGNILFMNERLKSKFGKRVIGKKCWQLYRDNKERCNDCPLIQGINLGETRSIEAFGCMGGRVIQITHTGMIYKKKKAVLEIFRDITKAKEVDKIKSEFISTTSHELRTSLAAIKESVMLILDGTAGKTLPEQSRFLGIAKKNIDRLTSLINDLLDISKIETGKIQLNIKTCDIGDVIKKDLNPLEILAEQKGLVLKTKFPKHLPKVNCDSDRIAQIITNLVGNSIKFTPKGGSIAVNARKTERGKAILVAVQDTGIGIDKKNIPKLFTKFGQADTSLTRRHGGTGLGLAICKELVKMHGGRIWVDSEPGRGSTFSFTLPTMS